jgi:hypothetical protein
MKKILLACFVTGTLSVFSSCGPTQLTVSNRPDRPYYSRPASPGPGYVWVEGDWVVRNGRYQWREGRWMKNRNRNRVYISGSWESRPGGYYWRRGYWR